MPNLLAFEWHRAADGYELVWPKPRKRRTVLTSDTGPYLAPKSDLSIKCRPLDEHPALFREFAALEETPEAVQAFANKYGVILGLPPLTCVLWYVHIKNMLAIVSAWEKGATKSFVRAWNAADLARISVEVGLNYREDEPPSLVIVPSSLISAMYLQLAQAITRSNHLQRCSSCGTWFLFGAGTGRRRSAHYCSDNCRKVAHRRRKEGHQ